MRPRSRAAPRPALLAVALAVTCLMGWLFKADCLLTGGWHDFDQYTTGCYSDAVLFWGWRGVSEGLIPYFQTAIEYPVLTGAAIWIEGWVARLPAGGNALTFLTAVALGNTLAVLAVLAMFEHADLRPSRLWAWVLAPPLILYLGHNWDMIAVLPAVAALLLARRGRWAAACAMIGLGTAAKLYPVVFLPAILIEPLRRRDWRRTTGCVAAAVAVWAAVNLPVALGAFANWWHFYAFSGSRGTTPASLWALAANFGWLRPDGAALNRGSAATFLIGSAAILSLGYVRRDIAGWTLAMPLLAWFLLTSKVYSPQYDLWLYPLLLLTVRDWRPIALFAAADIWCYFAEFWLILRESVTPDAVGRHGWLLAAALLRAAAMLWASADVLRGSSEDRIFDKGEPLERASAIPNSPSGRLQRPIPANRSD